MVEMLMGMAAALVLGIGIGICVPYTVRFPVGKCAQSPTGEHEFNQLKGAFAYCQFCTARKRFLNG